MKAKQKEKLIQQLADLADKEGMAEKDVLRFPDLWPKKDRKNLELFTGPMVAAAARINVEEIAKLRKKYESQTHATSRTGVEVQIRVPTVKHDRARNTKAKPRSKVFGSYTVTEIVRWMAREGWKKKKVAAAFEELQIEISPQTIRVQLAVFKKDPKCKIPKLKRSERRTLLALQK